MHNPSETLSADAPSPRPARPPAGVELRRRMKEAGLPLLAALGSAVSITRIRAEARITHLTATYPTTAALLADALGEHLCALAQAVAAAEARSAALAPEARLEQLILAWMNAAAAAPHAHRAFLFCAHALPPETGRSLDLYRRMAIEQIEAALAAAVPALAAHPEAPLALYPLIRLLLSDPNAWPVPPEPAERQAAARRLAGMLIAAAEAEAAGCWPRLGATAGPADGEPPLAITAHQARALWASVLHDVALGWEMVVTRHGRPVARIMPAKGQKQGRRKRRP